MLNIAIIGCGKISDIHASVLQRIDSARLIAVCD